MVVTRLSTKDIAVFKLEKVLVCAAAYKKKSGQFKVLVYSIISVDMVFVPSYFVGREDFLNSSSEWWRRLIATKSVSLY